MSNSSSSQQLYPTPTRTRPQTAGPRSFSNRAPIISNGNNNNTTTTTTNNNNNNNNNGKKREETPASVHDNIHPAPLPLYRYDSR